MSDDLTFGVRIDGGGSLTKEAKAAREELDALKKSTDNLADASKTNWAEVQRSANARAAAWKEGNAAADAAADKAWALANGYKEVGGQIVKAGGDAAKGMEETVFATARAQQAMVSLGREAMTGNVSRMPATLATIAQGLEPVGWAVAGVTAALAAGVYAWWEWETAAEEASDGARLAVDRARNAAISAAGGVEKTTREKLNDLERQIEFAESNLAVAERKRANSGIKGKNAESDALDMAILFRRDQLNSLQRQVDQVQSSSYEADQKANKPKANKPPKYKREFDPEGDYWDAVEEAGMKNRKKANEDAQKEIERAGIKAAKKIADAHEEEARRSQRVWEGFARNTQATLSDVFYDGFNGTFNDIGERFKLMLLQMAADAAAAQVTQSLIKMVVGALGGGGGGGGGWGGGGTMMAANGALFDGGTAAFASGGAFTNRMFDSATAFKFAAGGRFNLGVMGEAGPEAVMPLTRDRHGKLGVQASGTSSSVVNFAPTTHIHIDSRTDQAQVERLVSNAVQQGNAQLVDKLHRMGAL